jgi:hypothetical protein
MKGMTQEHLNALCAAGEAKKNDQGFLDLSEGRTLTLYVASGGATLAISKTSKGEHYVVALVDAYAGSIDTSSTSVKKAGFV